MKFGIHRGGLSKVCKNVEIKSSAKVKTEKC